ncbi:MAG: asparagine synthase (glutamine-hydrolyzing) [Candidatus Portnoybacteria bacterium RIFCSPLOWO2_12_FULL_39_9]|uniref:asparagine synthase (glutamine-hydrolyzing) n=1 Tax=Candidatus Portnoybacteria bacterium RIFCSPHIGHO2_12_FULL_38_9 TaxID=1801997 RepID=A0A1G2FGZ2_9BACT|nr:MAG: asparagine synthase (glutamine-hydrolyzing) [Candidatus Portnoybacteria bacterium RIFCSPHIGHO2_12_FULL_38_9]OGZ37713.1 MAG: asparagine synthase (glutamine-hydrolyzing) [Candidatus Portnoybacteria bacterium RIFCSPLOWO2_01_FULL_38_39]OGZ39694.1 MAG: asparagine synthase (glutamine-hydrolyzing) [Candidatus Portnoybacteria bacterium RIFCSPLOWO2_12_FULL_39_9]
MCGITGYFGEGNREILKKMTDSLRHRGPDDEGFYIGERIGLGHRRLSIIDLEGGHQPMTNEDKTIWVVFNGEIYNFQELKEKLEKQGHQFKTKSDTEAIVHLYEEKEEEFLEELNGMFAIALWDEKKEKLILARDRLGEKPLYYVVFNQNLVFGSELKALLAHPLVKKELDLGSLAKYLIYEYAPAPHSILKDIYKLCPGEYLVYKNNQASVKKYWEISFDKNPENLTKDEYLGELEKRLEGAVKKRLVADVPLGIFLSGGLDSTSLAYFAQKNSSKRIKTFSIGFVDRSFDESEYARQAARFLKTEHYEKILEPKDCLNLIPQIADFLDEPLADASLVPTYLLSQFTREKVTVALGGDGGDELFMGYPTFQAYRLDRIYQKIPSWLRNYFIQPLIKNLPPSFNNISFDFRLKRFIAGSSFRPEIKNQIWLGSFEPAQLRDLLAPSIYQQIKLNKIFEDIENYLEGVKSKSIENRLIYLYLKNYLQDDILVKTDRASMAVGLEVRAPFLDYTLVDFINSLPTEYKLRGFKTKYLFKELMKNKLPQNIVYRPKKGFGLPIAKWLKNDLKVFVLDSFSESKIKREGIFNFNYIKNLLQEHFSGQKDNRKVLWTLLIFEIWLEKWR